MEWALCGTNCFSLCGNIFKVNGQRLKPFISNFAPEESTLHLLDPN